MKRIILWAAGLALTLSAAAQPSDQMPGPGQGFPQVKERPTVEQEAQLKTDQMAAELGNLTETQLKQVYKFFKSDIQYRREHFEFDAPRPDGGFPAPPAGGFPGGRGGFPGGGPGGMRPGGMGPGGPRPGGSGSGMRPGNPPSGMPAFGGEIDYEELEKFNAKQDKKLRKIIGDENFERWRAAHPHEVPRMMDGFAPATE